MIINKKKIAKDILCNVSYAEETEEQLCIEEETIK
jgi:hypothetical protein